MRYGILGEKETTQREIARMLGISRSYVSRIEKNALQKMKGCFLACDQQDKTKSR